MTLKDYLEEYGSDMSTTYTALAVVAALRNGDSTLKDPDACYGPNSLLLAWDDGVSHFEIEVNGLDYEVYYLERNTGIELAYDSDESRIFVKGYVDFVKERL